MTRYEDEQPDAPDLGASVQLDSSDTLDGPPGGADALDAGYVPPDRPYALDEDAMTGAGMRAGDTLDERLARETPEWQSTDTDRAGRMTAAPGDDTTAVDVGIDGGAASAEEAAVHLVEGDTRVDGEPSVAADPGLADTEIEELLADVPDGAARTDAARDAVEVLDAGRATPGIGSA